MHESGSNGGHTARGGAGDANGGHTARLGAGDAKGGHTARVGADDAKGGHKARVGACDAKGGHTVRVGAGGAKGGHKARVGACDAKGGHKARVGACDAKGGHKARVGAGDAKGGHTARVGACDAKGGHKARPYGVVGSAPMVVGAPLVGVPFDARGNPVGLGVPSGAVLGVCVGGHTARVGADDAKGGHKARPYGVVGSAPMVVGAPLVGVPFGAPLVGVPFGAPLVGVPFGAPLVGVPFGARGNPVGLGVPSGAVLGVGVGGHKARGGAGDAKGGHKARPYGVAGSAPMVVGAPLVGVPFDACRAPVGMGVPSGAVLGVCVGGHKARVGAGDAKGGHKARPYGVVGSAPMVVGAPLVGVPFDACRALVGMGVASGASRGPVGLGGNNTRMGRRSIRLWGHDYSSDGAYFVTITVQDGMCVFGDVVRGEMQLNAAGRMAFEQWRSLQRRFAHVVLDAFVIMPNHMHGILWLTSGDGVLRLHDAHNTPPTTRPGLGQIVGAFKSASTVLYGRGVRTEGWRPFRKRLWHRNYYESVIRGDEHLRRARAYIANNPRKWSERRRRYGGRRPLDG